MRQLFDDFINKPPEKSAEISACETYRYKLYRTWDHTLPTLAVVMVNPSTADAEVDDPTILRLAGFAKRWGYGGILVMNLFALRSPDPTWLDSHLHPEGEDVPNGSFRNLNDSRLWWLIEAAARDRRPVLCAWGNNGTRQGRDQAFVAMARKRGVALICMGLTQAGHPKHPLARGVHRIPDDFVPIPFGEPA